jgi:phospholipid transport system substrate-binding protein
MKKRLNKVYFCIAIFLLLILHNALAEQDPVAMLEYTSQEMIHALKANQAKIKKSPGYTEVLSRQIILPKVDLNIMVRLALGRDEWSEASAAEREKFTAAFSSLLVRTYAAALAAYTDETIQFMPIRGGIEGKTRIQVESVIHQRGGPQIPVTYRLLKRQGQWRIYDLTVDGVSMIQSFKSQFSSYITRGGMAELLRAMEQQNKETS